MPPNAILVIADIVGFYPSILHDAGVKVLHEKLEKGNNKIVLTADLVNMAELVSQYNYFQFDSCIK